AGMLAEGLPARSIRTVRRTPSSAAKLHRWRRLRPLQLVVIGRRRTEVAHRLERTDLLVGGDSQNGAVAGTRLQWFTGRHDEVALTQLEVHAAGANHRLSAARL